MKAKIITGIILCCVSFGGFAEEELKGVVKSIIDGNTIVIAVNSNESYKVLLHGIDSPEPGQKYAEQAKHFLEKLLLNKSVTINIRGKDRLGNRLGDIHIDGAVDPRQELIKQGLAWTSEKEPIADLESLKEEARAKGKGLWSEENPTPPWTFRRQQTMLQQKSS
ncbi:thermonuclease family protein [soil metagenome]